MSLVIDGEARLREFDVNGTSTEQPGPRVEDDSSDEDSDSDDEGTKKQVSVKALLEEVLTKIRDGKLDLRNKMEYDDFAAHDGKRLASLTVDQDQPTALHIIASKDKKELPKLDDKMQPLIEFLSKQPDYLEKKSRSGHTSLFLAIESRKKEMVQWMCGARKDISSIIAITDTRNMNCLHVGINKRVKFLNLLIDNADPMTVAAKDANGNTPLHLSVEYKKCRKEQLQSVKKLIDKGDEAVVLSGPNGDFNNEELSPYLHHKESVRRAQAKEKKVAEEEEGRQKSNSRHLNPATTEKPGKDIPLARRDAAKVLGATSVHKNDQANRQDWRLNTQFDHRTKYGGGSPTPAVPSAPSTALPAAPDSASGNKKEEKSGGSSSKVDEATVRSIERLLKLHYLRSRDHSAAMDILYGRNTTTDQELYFDLSGNISEGVLTQSDLQNLLSKLKFEDTLQYVCIPKIRLQINQSAEKISANRRVARVKPSDEGGKRDLCYIFDRLRKKGVRSVLSLIVDDLESPAHSDEAIESALKNIDVEVWDWQKTDLCTEVIYKAAPLAREVNLYWSRNNAVLRGWSEEGGLKKLRELKSVNIHIQQGLESLARTQLNLVEFKDRMARLCPQVRIDLNWPETRHNLGETNSSRIEDQALHSTRHEWIQCMKDFCRLLYDAEKNYTGQKEVADRIEEPIKVALIDDGVDIKDLEYTFIGGRTFCPRVEHQNLNNPYYVSRSGHGTIMAKQVHLMCPRAQFYILRLEDCPSEDATTLNLTAKSAALAIRAAVQKGVDIISMSWTIDPPENDAERIDLENAIIEAAKADILMFCSATDKGAKQTDTYPSKATPNRIFTIGAANSSGAILDYVGNLTNINYTFPGDKVEVDGGTMRTNAREIVDGSSVATALAAGLAALILYCVQVRVLLAPDQDKENARRQFRQIKKHEGMKSAFSAINTTEESNHKFLKVWDVFGKQVRQKEQRDPDMWIDLIADVGTRLCTKIY